MQCAPRGRECPHEITVAMKIRRMIEIRTPTLLRRPVTSIGQNMHAFSSIGLHNIWWVHECALVRIRTQKEDPYICMT
jgi:hypothetical protein